MSGRAFVDSAAYNAYADKDAADYRQALATVQRLARDGTELYTTNFVVAEMYGLILNRMNRDTAMRVLDGLYASATRIVRATEGDERRA